jgi:beta-lactamase superfamily II metal-dependent hydrolase
MYLVMVLWVVRRRWFFSRALLANAAAAMGVMTAGWYAWTQPVGMLRMMVLDAGNVAGGASCAVVRLPSGDLWLLDAGLARGSSIVGLMGPVLRLEGARNIEGLVVTSLEAGHAGGAAEVMRMYSPQMALVSSRQWGRRGETLAGAAMERARSGRTVRELKAGDFVDFAGGAGLEVLWPPTAESGFDLVDRSDLILMWHYAGKRILTMDPRADRALALLLLARPEMRCDGVVFLGTQRGAGDAPLRRVMQPLNAGWVIWSGRGAWAGNQERGREWNTADGAASVGIDCLGRVSVGR